jgi:ClpP class serine protease
VSKQKRPDLQLPDTGKSFAEMTPEERSQFRRDIDRALRDDAIRVGRQRPRTARERQIAEEGQAERDACAQKRVDRLMRRGIRGLREP